MTARPARRGRCDSCGTRQRLRRDGSVPGHPGKDGSGDECPGSRKPARPLRFDGKGNPECGECLMYLFSPEARGIAEACASVGIEYGKSASQMLREYLTGFHERDHKEKARG